MALVTETRPFTATKSKSWLGITGALRDHARVAVRRRVDGFADRGRRRSHDGHPLARAAPLREGAGGHGRHRRHRGQRVGRLGHDEGRLGQGEGRRSRPPIDAGRNDDYGDDEKAGTVAAAPLARPGDGTVAPARRCRSCCAAARADAASLEDDVVPAGRDRHVAVPFGATCTVFDACGRAPVEGSTYVTTTVRVPGSVSKHCCVPPRRPPTTRPSISTDQRTRGNAVLLSSLDAELRRAHCRAARPSSSCSLRS